MNLQHKFKYFNFMKCITNPFIPLNYINFVKGAVSPRNKLTSVKKSVKNYNIIENYDCIFNYIYQEIK